MNGLEVQSILHLIVSNLVNFYIVYILMELFNIRSVFIDSVSRAVHGNLTKAYGRI